MIVYTSNVCVSAWTEDIRYQFIQTETIVNCEMGGNNNNVDYSLFTPNEIEQQKKKIISILIYFINDKKNALNSIIMSYETLNYIYHVHLFMLRAWRRPISIQLCILRFQGVTHHQNMYRN